MNEIDAKELAQQYLCGQLELEICVKLPDGLYEFNHEEELLFGFHLFGQSTIGASEYISVSKLTGKVRYRGFLGQ